MHKTTGLTHLIKSTGYSLKGLKSAVKYETAFRHELSLGVILIPLAFWLAGSKIELILMIGSYLLVLIVELLNSAIESIVDRVGTEYQGSAAVFVALVNCAAVWAVILFG